MDWSSYPNAVDSLFADEKLEQSLSSPMSITTENSFPGPSSPRSRSSYLEGISSMPEGLEENVWSTALNKMMTPIQKELWEDEKRLLDQWTLPSTSSSEKESEGTPSAPPCIQRYFSTDGKACLLCRRNLLHIAIRCRKSLSYGDLPELGNLTLHDY